MVSYWAFTSKATNVFIFWCCSASTNLGFPRNQKSRSAQFQNLKSYERQTLFSPLKHVKFKLSVNLKLFFSKTLHAQSVLIQLLLFSLISKLASKTVTFLTRTLKSVKTAIIVSKLNAHEAFLKKNNFRFTESLNLTCFKGENNVRRS